jgi:acyl carrier protein
VSETTVDTEAAVRTVLAAHAKSDAATVGVQADLYAAGLTSHASVNVMLALEDEFDIEFPDSMLRKATFVSIAAIAGAVQELTS